MLQSLASRYWKFSYRLGSANVAAAAQQGLLVLQYY
jgi:hypothetical protein